MVFYCRPPVASFSLHVHVFLCLIQGIPILKVWICLVSNPVTERHSLSLSETFKQVKQVNHVWYSSQTTFRFYYCLVFLAKSLCFWKKKKSVCLKEKVSSGAYLAQISTDFPPHLWIQHFLLSHLPCFLFEPPIFPASNGTHVRRQCHWGLSDQTDHVQGGNRVRYLCSIKVHICLSARVSTSLPQPFSKEAPQAWFNMVNKAPTVSQSCWRVHREPVNGCIFPLLLGHNKTLNMQDQKTDSSSRSCLDEWNSTTLS